MRIAFGEFLPDRPALDTPHLMAANNVVAAEESYLPLAGPAAFSDALDEDPTGLWIINTAAGAYKMVAGTTTKLQLLTGTSWSALQTGRSGPGSDFDSAAQFGTSLYVINPNDGLVAYDIESGDPAAAVANAPAAKFLGIFDEFLFALNLDDDPSGLRWCDGPDATNWTTGLSGDQTFPDGGPITGQAGAGDIIIQERALRRAIRDPGGDTWQFQKLADVRGSIAPQSIIPFGNTVAYLSEDGFWFDGQPIGAGKINSWFFGQITQKNLYSVLGRYDPLRPVFVWHFRVGETSVYENALIYNWQVGRWSTGNMDVLMAARGATPGYTLEQLGAEYPNIETVPYSLDSRVWQGGRPVYAVIDTNRKVAFLEGDYLEADFQTGDRQLIQGWRSRLRGARIMGNASGARLRVRTKKSPIDTGVLGSYKTAAAAGRIPLNADGLYHRFYVNVPAATPWTHQQGIEIEDRDVSRSGRW